MKRPRRWSDQEILDALRYWAERHGRVPKYRDWQYQDPEGLRPTNMTVWQRCGGWNDALLMAGLEPPSPENTGPRHRKFSRPEARRLRKLGLSNEAIGRALGVHGSAIAKAIGKRPKDPPGPKTAAERREARIAALKKALGDG